MGAGPRVLYPGWVDGTEDWVGSQEGEACAQEVRSSPIPTGHPCPLTARDMQAGRAEGLASSIRSNAGIGALVLLAHVQQDQAVLLR